MGQSVVILYIWGGLYNSQSPFTYVMTSGLSLPFRCEASYPHLFDGETEAQGTLLSRVWQVKLPDSQLSALSSAGVERDSDSLWFGPSSLFQMDPKLRVH